MILLERSRPEMPFGGNTMKTKLQRSNEKAGISTLEKTVSLWYRRGKCKYVATCW
jgi:hypothetical protein